MIMTKNLENTCSHTVTITIIVIITTDQTVDGDHHLSNR